MSSPTFWACEVIDRKASPAKRLEEACRAAQRNLGSVPAAVHVHPQTAAETPASAVVTLVADPHVPSPYEYRFVRDTPNAEDRP